MLSRDNDGGGGCLVQVTVNNEVVFPKDIQAGFIHPAMCFDGFLCFVLLSSGF